MKILVKELLPRQVVCNEKNDKGKPCHGGLKRYYPLASYYNELNEALREEIRKECGEKRDLVLLRCETCGTLFKLPEALQEKYA